MRGPWHWIYAVGPLLALYLNMFVLITQSFLRVPALRAMAPTQSEPPFQIAQLLALVIFGAIGAAVVARFRIAKPGVVEPQLRPHRVAS